MLKSFVKYISKNKLFTKKQKLLVAVSGGMDSVLLCHLLSKADFKFGIAHCNFQLRGRESDADEKFVSQLAKHFNVPFYVKNFNTENYAIDKGVSVQMAARELRYCWFEEIRIKNKYNFIAVAHHQDDEIETFFINLIRGTGIAGLHGIKAKAGWIIRPLLFTERKEIEEYIKKNKIKYREDSSNSSVKYLRNKIRHKLIPFLKELNPDIENTIKSNIERIKQIENIFQQLVGEKREELISKEKDIIKFDIKKLLELKNLEMFLFEFLKPYGFSGDIIGKIASGLKKESGKQFFSPSYRLLKDRTHLLVVPLEKEKKEQTYIITEGYKELNSTLHLKFKKENIVKGFEVIRAASTGMFDLSKLIFPLTIRKWKQGDFFFPLGMKGKKKLSDFFTDIKLSIFDKENIWLLCNGNDIIWIIGHRIDNRYKVTDKTKKVFIAEIVNK